MTAPTRIQRQRTKGWRMPPGRAVTERGLYWPDVARELGTTSWSVKNMIQAYMRRNGIPGEPPGRTPKDTSDPPECKEAPGSLAAVQPRTGGGGRGDPDDFLGRLEHELDRLARTDAKLVEEERSVARQRAELAARIERLRTAGEVYRAVMAGRAA